MEDLTSLIGHISTTLIPALPYLLKAGEMAGEEACKEIGKDAWEGAKSLWARLGGKLTAKPATKEVLEAIVVNADEDTQAALRFQLKQLLTEDKELQSLLLTAWREAQPAGVTNHNQQSGGIMFNDKVEFKGTANIAGRDQTLTAENKPE